MWNTFRYFNVIFFNLRIHPEYINYVILFCLWCSCNNSKYCEVNTWWKPDFLSNICRNAFLSTPPQTQHLQPLSQKIICLWLSWIAVYKNRIWRKEIRNKNDSIHCRESTVYMNPICAGNNGFTLLVLHIFLGSLSKHRLSEWTAW